MQRSLRVCQRHILRLTSSTSARWRRVAERSPLSAHCTAESSYLTKVWHPLEKGQQPRVARPHAHASAPASAGPGAEPHSPGHKPSGLTSRTTRVALLTQATQYTRQRYGLYSNVPGKIVAATPVASNFEKRWREVRAARGGCKLCCESCPVVHGIVVFYFQSRCPVISRGRTSL